jgi:hypothetical protein
VTPGDSTEPMTSTGSAGSSLPKFPTRPEDVQAHRAAVKAERAAQESTAAAAVKASSPGTASAPAARPAPAAHPAEQRPTGPRPAEPQAARPSAGGRRVRLTLSRVDPWSALKMSFLLSVALGIAMVVAVAALWLLLKGMGVFDQVNNLVGSIIQDGDKKFDIMDFVGFGRVVSLSIVFAVIDVVIFTAIATLGAFIYNVSASLVGGLGLTLTDD